jgi:hypothetical protein
MCDVCDSKWQLIAELRLAKVVIGTTMVAPVLAAAAEVVNGAATGLKS